MSKRDIEVTYAVDTKNIWYAFVGAFEGGSNYWVHDAIHIDGPKHDIPNLVWWGKEEVFDGFYSFKLIFDDPDLEEGNAKGTMIISEDLVDYGLNKMAKNDPEQFQNLISEDGDADAITYDVFLQYIVFGEVIYG